ncbi:MAG: ABC transporter permease [Deltaproteobacteria bacterium]|nr:ABC transporter permease [Deltaproteobacteria bacterium]
MSFLHLVRLALRNLFRQRRRSLLTLAATGVGVTMILVGHGLTSSFIESLVDDIVQRRLGQLVVRPKLPPGSADLMPLDPAVDVDAVLPSILQTPGVTAAAPRIRFAGLITNGRAQTMVLVTAVDVAAEARVCPLRPDDVVGGVGRFLHVDDAAGAVLGKELARGLKGTPGTSLTLQASSARGAQNAVDVDVVGVGRAAGFLESKGTITVPLAIGRTLTRMEGKATEIAIAIDDAADVATVQAALRARLPASLEVVGWGEVMPFLKETQMRMRIILGGAGGVLFAIAIFGVVNTMLMSVWERVREIGTLLALGLRRRHIVRLFLIEGGLLGLTGGVIGGVLGLLLVTLAGVRGLSFSPPGSGVPLILHPQPSIEVAVVAVVVAALGAVLASAWPARRAAALDPVEALRA